MNHTHKQFRKSSTLLQWIRFLSILVLLSFQCFIYPFYWISSLTIIREAFPYPLIKKRNYLELMAVTRYFSHAAKGRIFKNLNLRKKVDCKFRGTFLKNRFRQLKLYSNPPSWLARTGFYMSTFWNKRLKFTFLRDPTFQVWSVEVRRQRRLKSMKTGISS